MCGAEAKENRHRTTITTFIFQEIGAMFRTHLCSGHVRATAAHQLLRIEFLTDFSITTCLTAVVRLLTLETHIVGIAIHCQGSKVTSVTLTWQTIIFYPTKQRQYDRSEMMIFRYITYLSNALRFTSCLSVLIGSRISSREVCLMSALQIGHIEKPNVIRGPFQRLSSTVLQQ